MTVSTFSVSGTRTSMLQDRLKGRRLELGALNGTLIRQGRQYGLPVAVNERIVSLLGEADAV